MVNLEPFYQAVDQYALYRWLPLAVCLVLLALGVCMVVMGAARRKDHPLGVAVGLLAASLVALVPLSALALHRGYGAGLHAWLVDVSSRHAIHGWFALALAVLALATVLLAGMRRPRRENAALDIALGLVLSLQVPLALAFVYVFFFYWRPLWAAKLEYVVPISASVLVAVSTLAYAIRRAEPRAAGTNRFYQFVIGALLTLLAFLAAGNYISWGNWRYGAFVNAYEFYHYYIGSKYSPEVGYYHMYDATVVADSQTGKKFAKTTIRNLTTGVKMETSKVMAEQEKYRSLFSEARWQEFLMDIRWFKTKLTPGRFGDMIGDKGYNATPVWTMLVGGILSENVSTTDRAPAIVEYPMRGFRAVLSWLFGEDPFPGEPNGMLFLALLDIFLIVAAACCVVWAFGYRAALLMLIVLGTSYVMKYSHMKGAYLRTDFTMALIFGICLLKKQRYAPAGAFIAYSCLSRVFPAVFFFGMGAKLAWHAIGALPAFLRRTGAIGAIAAVLLVLGGLLAGALVVGPVVLEKMVLHPTGANPLELADSTLLAIRVLFGLAAGAGALIGVLVLWGWWTREVPRRYLSFFASAAATVVILVSAAFLYHSAQKPAHQPSNYMDKIGEEGTMTRSIGNFLAKHFDGGLTVFGEYKAKIGRHNTEISPWRVGFKYWFIGVGKKRPLWAGWTRAEKGETGWVNGAATAADPQPGFLSGLWDEINGPKDPAIYNSPEFAKIKDSGSFERIRYRDENTGFWTALYNEVKDNDVITRSVIHTREKRGIFNLILLLVLGISFFLVPGLKDHEATAWSFVLVFFLVSATYYYFILLLVPLLFFSPYLSRPSRALGIIMLLMAAWPGYYLYTNFNWKQTFSTYYYHSVMYMVISLYMMLLGAGATLRAAGKGLKQWRAQRA